MTPERIKELREQTAKRIAHVDCCDDYLYEIVCETLDEIEELKAHVTRLQATGTRLVEENRVLNTKAPVRKFPNHNGMTPKRLEELHAMLTEEMRFMYPVRSFAGQLWEALEEIERLNPLVAAPLSDAIEKGTAK